MTRELIAAMLAACWVATLGCALAGIVVGTHCGPDSTDRGHEG